MEYNGQNLDQHLVVLDFYADWCGPCKQIAPKFKELSEKYSESANFYKIDVDKYPDLAKSFNIRSIPTIIVKYNGNVEAILPGNPFGNVENTVGQIIKKYISDTKSGI